MPELPEVETTRRAMQAHLTGRRIADVVQRRADLRFPLPADLVAKLKDRRVIDVGRRAKYILTELDDGNCLILHLGMSGRLVLGGEAAARHEHLTFTFDDNQVLRFVDPRRFGMLDLWPTANLGSHRWLGHLGVEPLGNSFDAQALQRLLAGRRGAIKTTLMDQRLIVGVGNIYACESLFRARISPRRTAGRLRRGAVDRLAPAIRAVLEDAIAAGGSSLRDYVRADGQIGNFQSFFDVYGRAGEACRRCAKPVRRIVQSGRSTFLCPICQR